jgi:hypothetical protein
MDEYLNKKNALENNVGKYINTLLSKITKYDEFNNQINQINELIEKNNDIGNGIIEYLKSEEIIELLNKDKNSKDFQSIIQMLKFFLINNISSKINYVKEIKEEKNYIVNYDNNKILSLLEQIRFKKNPEINSKMIIKIKKIIIAFEEFENNINSKNLIIINQKNRTREIKALKNGINNLLNYLFCLKKFSNKEDDKKICDNIIIQYLQKIELIYNELNIYHKEVIENKIKSLKSTQDFMQKSRLNNNSNVSFIEKKFEIKENKNDKFDNLRNALNNIINSQINIEFSSSCINIDKL